MASNPTGSQWAPGPLQQPRISRAVKAGLEGRQLQELSCGRRRQTGAEPCFLGRSCSCKGLKGPHWPQEGPHRLALEEVQDQVTAATLPAQLGLLGTGAGSRCMLFTLAPPGQAQCQPE